MGHVLFPVSLGLVVREFGVLLLISTFPELFPTICVHAVHHEIHSQIML